MRLIDADWVFGHLKPYDPSDEEWSVTGGTALRLIHKAVDNAPTVNVEPVVHGRWKASSVLLECQNCGEIYSRLGGNGGKAWNYCPNCGASMDYKE